MEPALKGGAWELGGAWRGVLKRSLLTKDDTVDASWLEQSFYYWFWGGFVCFGGELYTKLGQIRPN